MNSLNIPGTDLEKLFYSRFNRKIKSCEALSSHGSDRIILRLRSEDDQSAIGIINNNEKENRAFLGFSEQFFYNGINVPEIYGVSNNYLSYLIEDLGDITLFEYIKKNENDIPELYEKAIDELQRFQLGAGKTINYDLCYQFREFAGENIDFDLNYFKERFLKNFYKDNIDILKLENDLSFLKSKLLEVPRDYFLYRDFQSRNIMIKNEKLYFIDFQSGRKGALQYDLASLLFDARANIPQKIRESLMKYYIKKAKENYSIDAANFEKYFWYFAIVRILQALGAYGYVGIVKGKSTFLESVPYALKNINMLLEEKIENNLLNYLRKIFKEMLNPS